MRVTSCKVDSFITTSQCSHVRHLMPAKTTAPAQEQASVAQQRQSYAPNDFNDAQHVRTCSARRHEQPSACHSASTWHLPNASAWP